MRNFVRLLLLLAVSATFALGSPVQVLHKMSGRLIDQIKIHQHNFDARPDLVFQIVNKTVMPVVAKEQMARNVVGANAWKKSTKKVRQDFIRYFTNSVVSTYSGAVKSYKDQKVVFYPVSSNYSQSRYVSVKSVIEPSDGPNVYVIYQMVRVGNNWKILDFSVDGVSLVSSYRAQYRSIIAQEGLAGLNQRLKLRS